MFKTGDKLCSSANERKAKIKHGEFILNMLSSKKLISKPTRTTWIVLLAWMGIIATILATLLGGCRTAEATELKASWYSVSALKRDGQWDITHGRTASGQLFTDSGLTAASWDFPLGTKVKVTRNDKKAFVVVMVNDRTARRFKGKRIDLSKAAFMQLADLKQGIVSCQVERVK